MANPTLKGASERSNLDNLGLEVEQLIVNNKVVISSQQAKLADVATNAATNAPTDASTTVDLNAVFSDTEAEAALNALGTKLNSTATIVNAHGTAINNNATRINTILDILEAHGLMADA